MHKASLGGEDLSLFKWRARPFCKGRLQRNSKIIYEIKIFKNLRQASHPRTKLSKWFGLFLTTAFFSLSIASHTLLVTLLILLQDWNGMMSFYLVISYYLWFREVHYYKALQIVFGHLNLAVIWFPLLSKELKWVNDSLAFVDIYDFNIWILGQGYISWSRWRHYGTNEKHASK